MVKYLPDKTGRFTQRPHYKPEQLDRECEDIITNFLTDRHGRVEFPVSTEDLTVLIEQSVEDLDQYADLSVYGTEVEGVTEFQAGRKPTVKIAAVLANDERRQNRLRTTLTHEFGHVRLHTYLWEFEPLDADLLRQSPHPTKQICKRDNILDVRQSDWMEWQAGYVSGSLLMPATHVRRVISAYREEENLFGALGVNGRYGGVLIHRLQQQFQVSAEAARVRLLELRLLAHTDAGPSLFD